MLFLKAINSESLLYEKTVEGARL
jgi:hypothetical protein